MQYIDTNAVIQNIKKRVCVGLSSDWKQGNLLDCYRKAQSLTCFEVLAISHWWYQQNFL